MGIFLLIAAIAVVFLLLFLRRRDDADKPASVVEEGVAPKVVEHKEKPSEGSFYAFTIDTLFPDSYTAIDFETATASGMACQLGLVQVDGGKIVLEREFLIRPPENTFDEWNIRVHGITPEKTESSPSFEELWPELRPLLEGRFIIAHNVSFDESVLEKNLEYYGLEEPEVIGFGCTSAPFDMVSLYSASTYFGIDLGRHHDALADARACALLVLEYRHHFGETLRIPKLKEKDRRAIDKKNRGWVDNMDSIPDNYFKGKTVVITGMLNDYSRDELAEILKGLGARVTSSISRKTSIVIVGDGSGPAKLQQIETLRAEGCSIETFNEEDLRAKLP